MSHQRRKSLAPELSGMIPANVHREPVFQLTFGWNFPKDIERLRSRLLQLG